jgi:hypothetical protein
MEQQLDFGNCYYRPSFFKMKIDLPIDLSNLNELPDGAFGLYFHEYIHFVQDISTIYGLMNISTINYYIQFCSHKIYNDKNPLFEVPIYIVPKEIDRDYGHLNFKLRPIYIGSSIKEKSKNISSFNYRFDDFEYEPGLFVTKVLIQFTDNFNNLSRELEFGGNHVTEGMAYLCEQYHYKSILPDAEAYPYKIIEEIVKIEYPEVLSNKYFLIMICDIALMSYHPGLSFVRLLKFFSLLKIHLSDNLDYKDIYKMGMEEIKGSHVAFSDLIEVVRKEIKKNFKADYFNPIKDWIDTILDRIKVIRDEVPGFVNDIVTFGKPTENEFFILFMNIIGSPLVLNADDDATISLPNNFTPQEENFNPSIFWALNQILKVYSRPNKTPCELIKFCSNSRLKNPNITVDDNCVHSPWLKTNDKNLCPFALVWHHWSLRDFAPKY